MIFFYIILNSYTSMYIYIYANICMYICIQSIMDNNNQFELDNRLILCCICTLHIGLRHIEHAKRIKYLKTHSKN
jgi:hypothetical protein